MKKQSTAKLRNYYYLTKPGIIRGNAFAATAGFFLALNDSLQLSVYASMLVGISLVIASACVFNNCIDRDIDKRMKRTQKRGLITGAISVKNALIFGTIIGLSGFLLLLFSTNRLTATIALVGFVFYVGIYAWAKRNTVYGTLVGSVSGAIPPIVGYCSLSNTLDTAAVLLFMILVAWQMPHFYAIAIYRHDEYAAAGLPVLPVVRGVDVARRQIVAYIAAFIAVSSSLAVAGYTGLLYVAICVPLGMYWLYVALTGQKVSDAKKWARHVFGVSLLVLSGLCSAIVLGKVWTLLLS